MTEPKDRPRDMPVLLKGNETFGEAFGRILDMSPKWIFINPEIQMEPLAKTWSELALQIKQDEARTLIVATERGDWGHAPEPWIVQKGQDRPSLGALVVTGPIELRMKKFGRVALLYGEKHILPFLESDSYFKKNDRLDWAGFAGSKPLESFMKWMSRKNPNNFYRALICNQRQYLVAMLSPKFEFSTKLLTTIVHLFPKVIESNLPADVELVPFGLTNICDRLDAFNQVQKMTKREMNAHYLALTTAFSLVPAYPRGDKIKHQLYQRYRAAAAMRKIVALDKKSFMAPLHSCDLVSHEIPGIVIIVACLVVARDKNGEADRMVKHSDLLPLDDSAELHGATEWGRALLNQMRVVYSKFRLNTLAMASEALGVAKDCCLTLPPQFEHESKALEVAIDYAHERPYVGMRAIQDDVMKISNYTLWAAVGIMYHAKTLEEKPEKAEEFGHFKSQGLLSRLKKEQYQMAESMVKDLPGYKFRLALYYAQREPNVWDVVTLKNIFKELPPDAEDIVLEILTRKNHNGLWFQIRKLEKQIEHSNFKFPVPPDMPYTTQTVEFLQSLCTKLEELDRIKKKETLESYDEFFDGIMDAATFILEEMSLSLELKIASTQTAKESFITSTK